MLTWAPLMLMLSAAVPAAEPGLFNTDEVLEVTLTGPFGQLFKNKQDHSPLPFTLTNDGVSYGIQARLHGYSRLRVCAFPPMLLRFPSSGTQENTFTKASALRLVTHCRNAGWGEENLLEEYAAHRIFNLLSEAGYRVRLLRITYEDTATSRSDSLVRYGFLLEPHEQLEARIGVRRVNLPGLPKRRHDLHQAALIYVFQYLIANTDWGFVKADNESYCCHNGILFERNGEIIVVPYDFDLSGLVNAPYAYPDQSLGIRKVTHRLYRGVCTDRDVLRTALRQVKASRPEILAVIRNVPGLPPKSVARDIRFIEGFFERAENEEKLLRRFEKRCLE